MEFLRPLTDLRVKEKEMARFECEISRENAKVCDCMVANLCSPINLFTFWSAKMRKKKVNQTYLIIFRLMVLF